MPRTKKKVAKAEDNIKEKLEFIGLDLDNIPKNLLEYQNLNYRAMKNYIEKQYKQYRYVDVEDIEILLTPTNRLDPLKEKFEKASPLGCYLDSENEENIMKYAEFINMLKNVEISEIEKIEEEQKKLLKSIPYKVKFNGNYLWQIYYSKNADKYFMMVPTEDLDYSAFFCLLKKKIENKKNDKIFVPISYAEYSNELLKNSEIKDIENYLWLFTKDYPLIYEVYDKKDKVSVQIIGETEVYDKLKTMYKVVLPDKKEAMKFYKLLKALFILQTELPNYYEFKTNINKDGKLEFYLDSVAIEYEMLPEFIEEQIIKVISLKSKIIDEQFELDEKLSRLKKEEEILQKEYFAKEKQISTYLECKKSFFGKVKYFFKYGKKKQKENIIETVDEEEAKIHVEKEKYRPKEKNHTLDELVESYKEYGEKENLKKTTLLDINALKLKIKNLKKKIENASNYIKEIDEHKKSIFEFWKYTNKDEVQSLDEGEEEEVNVTKVEKTFVYEDDFEKFGENVDKLQRKKFTDQELESVFVATTDLLELINKMKKGEAENKEFSAALKQIKLKMQDTANEEEEFDIFGKLSDDRTKEKTLGNKTHRETERNICQILNVRKGSKGLELKKNLTEVLENLESALTKNFLAEDIYIYKASNYEMDLSGIWDFSLNIEDEIKNVLNEERVRSKIYLYKTKLKKGTNFVAFSNIIFFNNKNMTLPIGMNLSNKILVDLDKLDMNDLKTKEVRKLDFENKNDDFSKVLVKVIEVNEM